MSPTIASCIQSEKTRSAVGVGTECRGRSLCARAFVGEIIRMLPDADHLIIVREIPDVIRELTTTSPSIQLSTILRYFTPRASFTHPFCRTGSFNIASSRLPLVSSVSSNTASKPRSFEFSSRQLIIQVYRWYKIMSPRIELTVNSVAFDKERMLLYVGIHQLFKIQAVPFYRAAVSLTTVLTLTHDPAGQERPERQLEREVTKQDRSKYYIQSQNDLYQTSEFIKFALPWGIGMAAVVIWGFVATFFCVIGAVVFAPVTWLEERWSHST